MIRAKSPIALSLLLLFLLLPRRAGADVGLSDEATYGGSQSSGASEATSFFSDRLAGLWDVNERLLLRLDTTYTRFSGSRTSRPDNVFDVGLDVSWDFVSHFALGVDASFSPRSSLTWFVPIRYQDALGVVQPGRAVFRASTQSYAAEVSLEYDSADESDIEDRNENRVLNAESVVGIYLGAMSYSTSQRFVALRGAQGEVISVEQLTLYCEVNPCSEKLRAVLKHQSSELVAYHVSSSFTETLFETTDLGLTGTYYLYQPSLDQAGSYGASVFGRAMLGEAIPIEPLTWTIRPDVARRIGPVELSASFQYGPYAISSGGEWVIGTKVQYRFSKNVKAWLGGDLQRDQDSLGGGFSTLWASLGVRAWF